MATFKQVVEAFLASRECEAATLSRLSFWVGELGATDIRSITPEDVDQALVRLAERGKLKGSKVGAVSSGKPLGGATMYRYVAQLGSVFKYAKRSRLLPRAFVSPTWGIEREPEEEDPDKYLRAEEVARLVASARVHDRQWGKMAALVTVAFHTGLRVGSLLQVRGRDLDLQAGTLTVACTKNGDPITTALSAAACAELASRAAWRPFLDRVVS